MDEPLIECPVCDRAAVADIAASDVSVRTAAGYSVCELKPNEHDDYGFRYYIHLPEP
jgi:hypothetical protein